MKIGIITQPLANNYGGILQNYALQQVLLRLGHSPITVDQPTFAPQGSVKARLMDLNILTKNFVKSLLRKKKNELPSRKAIIDYQKGEKLQEFIKSHIKKTSKLFKYKDIRQECQLRKFEAYIVGSDQVWRPKYNLNLPYSFLSFTQGMNVKRIAYAASFGTEKWEFGIFQTYMYKRLLKHFDALSVREKSAIQLCEKHFDQKPTLVLDPTMLLDTSEYTKLIAEDKTMECSVELFAYFLTATPQKRNIVDMLAKEYNYTPYFICPNSTEESKSTIPKISHWLNAFSVAKIIVCDSFHGVVFSILFNKDFLVLPNTERGNTRFDTILEIFELEDRLVLSEEDAIKVSQRPICWSKINSILREKRICSISFLKESLDNESRC